MIKFLASGLLALFAVSQAAAQEDHEIAPLLTITISPAQIVTQAGSQAQALVRLHITPPFHINSNQPNDPSLIPTSFILLDPPEGIKLLKVNYPQPQKLEVKGEPEPWLVFNDQSLLRIDLQTDSSVPPGRYQLWGQLHYQACNERVCQMPDSQSADFILQVIKNSHAQ